MLRTVILAVLFVASVANSQITVTTIADIAGDGNNHAIAASGMARWISFATPITNVNNVRDGDANISATQGTIIQPGGSDFWPSIPEEYNEAGLHHGYSLSNSYYRVASGDTLTIKYANY